MLKFVDGFLKARTFRVRVGTSWSPSYLQQGVPQGSVLIVILFAVAINGITTSLPDVSYSLSVNDLALWFSAFWNSTAELRLQHAIDRTSRWAEEHDFHFSSSKSVAMHFYRLKSHHPDPDLILHGSRLPIVYQHKVLGLVFDKRFTWFPHLRAFKA